MNEKLRKMKKIISAFILILLCIGISNCKKERFTKFPTPSWQTMHPEKYPASMTAVVRLSDELNRKLSVNDKMAAFIDEECRGAGQMVVSDSGSVFFVLVHGAPSENDPVVFKYYSSRTSYMYTSQDTLNFEIDGNYGTVDRPKMLHMKVVK